jgi:hypothetical protein
MNKNAILAVISGVPFGAATATILLMQPPSVPLMIGLATVGLIMVAALGFAAAHRAKEESEMQPQG